MNSADGISRGKLWIGKQEVEVQLNKHSRDSKFALYLTPVNNEQRAIIPVESRPECTSHQNNPLELQENIVLL